MQKPVQHDPLASAVIPGGQLGGSDRQNAVHELPVTPMHFVSLQFTSGLHCPTTQPGVASHSYVSAGSVISGHTWGAPLQAQSGTEPHSGATPQTSSASAQWWNSGLEQSAHGPGSHVGQQSSS